MWTANRRQEDRTTESAADLGLVTLGGDPAGVYLGGERRWVAVCSPGGYQWRPRVGDKVLVVKAGDQRELPCLVGQRQPTLEKDSELEPGAVRVQGGGGTLDLNSDGVSLAGKGIALNGVVTVNGETLEHMIERIAAEVVASMLA